VLNPQDVVNSKICNQLFDIKWLALLEFIASVIIEEEPISILMDMQLYALSTGDPYFYVCI